MESASNKRVGRQPVANKLVQEKSLIIVPAITHVVQSGPVQGSATLTVGKVAKMAQVSTDTIRYYEKEGLITPAKKSHSGYRLYHPDALRRLHFIKHAKHAGFSLSEIRELLMLKNRKDACCNDVQRLAVEKKLQLEQKIKSLKIMSQTLTELLNIGTDKTKPLDQCPILAALERSLNLEKPASREEQENEH